MGRKLLEYRFDVDREDQVAAGLTKLCLLTVIVVTAFSFTASAADTRFLTMGTVRARALAMGSAFHSVEDDFTAGLYNPAAFKQYASRHESRFRLFFNPAASITALNDFSRYDYDFVRDDRLTFDEALYAVGHFLKGVTLTTSKFDCGVQIGEEIVSDGEGLQNPSRMYSFEGMMSRQFHSMFFNLRIAPPVSLGIAGTLYSSRMNEKTRAYGGYSFGVLLKPNRKVNVGIVYYGMPDKFADARFGLESIENETATAALSYMPDTETVMSADIRAVNKEKLDTSREIHVGVERRLFRRLALRAGYFRKKESGDNVISMGVGILPHWNRIGKYTGTTRTDLFSYTMIMEQGSIERRWHVLSLLLRL